MIDKIKYLPLNLGMIMRKIDNAHSRRRLSQNRTLKCFELHSSLQPNPRFELAHSQQELSVDELEE